MDDNLEKYKPCDAADRIVSIRIVDENERKIYKHYVKKNKFGDDDHIIVQKKLNELGF